MSDTFTCPNCGAEVPAKAKACPECGSDEKTGWSDETIYDGTDIEDPDEFDYDDWKRRELGSKRPTAGWLWWAIAVLLLAGFVYLMIR